jgi:hypothetical protein
MDDRALVTVECGLILAAVLVAWRALRSCRT